MPFDAANRCISSRERERNFSARSPFGNLTRMKRHTRRMLIRDATELTVSGGRYEENFQLCKYYVFVNRTTVSRAKIQFVSFCRINVTAWISLNAQKGLPFAARFSPSIGSRHTCRFHFHSSQRSSRYSLTWYSSGILLRLFCSATRRQRSRIDWFGDLCNFQSHLL